VYNVNYGVSLFGLEGLTQRDQLVADTCQKQGTPLTMTLGGGYGKNAWRAQYRSIRNLIPD